MHAVGQALASAVARYLLQGEMKQVAGEAEYTMDVPQARDGLQVRYRVTPMLWCRCKFPRQPAQICILRDRTLPLFSPRSPLSVVMAQYTFWIPGSA